MGIQIYGLHCAGLRLILRSVWERAEMLAGPMCAEIEISWQSVKGLTCSALWPCQITPGVRFTQELGSQESLPAAPLAGLWGSQELAKHTWGKWEKSLGQPFQNQGWIPYRGANVTKHSNKATVTCGNAWSHSWEIWHTLYACCVLYNPNQCLKCLTIMYIVLCTQSTFLFSRK